MISAGLGLLAAAVVVSPRPTSTPRLSRLHDVVVDVEDPARPTDDPLAVATAFDLLAACLRAGLPMATAAAAVAVSAPAPLSDSLRRGADLLTLGADPAVAWEAAVADPATESLARMARRSARSGSSLAGAMTELAAQRRAEAEDASAAQAERAGVLISGPLGLCFLPAFVCLGIVPVVVGLAGRVLGGGLL
ncbi:type II secretion system F family protein [Antrihabitans cavernicola]|uniref:Type II secretion system F family protein n=1 Tax=Antrihabitans cavernicola TaxID=2495913 RepID=A0A5A7SE62_9NOCA|nr:type II secretion system F family protein [Spelaeibacter cavernicola]KAA0024450.1 type II secretion system F family protein [Spelaeibacter cavernicola]